MIHRSLKAFLFLFLIMGVLSAHTNDPLSEEEDCECGSSPAPEGGLYQCHKSLNRCKLDRKNIGYVFNWEQSSPKRAKLTVSGAKAGKSNVVYSCQLRITDERRSTGNYTIKVPYSYYKGYTWENRNLNNALVITYNTRTQQYTFEAIGTMADYKDLYEGKKVETYLKQRAFSPKQMIRAAAVYLIMDYNKALRSF